VGGWTAKDGGAFAGWTDVGLALMRAAGRAPSAHNTQPWWVEPMAGGSYELRWHAERELPVGDPTRRDLFLGIGAFVEAFLIASAESGTPLRVTGECDSARRVVARFVPARAPYETPFTVADLRARRTARGAYVPGALPDAVFEAARAELGPTAGLWRADARSFAPLARVADRWLLGDPAVVGELRAWMRLTGAVAPDGLGRDALALSPVQGRVLAGVLRPGAYRALRPVGLPRVLAAASRGLLRGDGSVVVLTSAGSTPDEVIEVGRGLMRVWLRLSRYGCATHPLSQLVDCARTAEVLAARVGARPMAVFRVGWPVGEPARSRRLSD
jgi:hypothetical protein